MVPYRILITIIIVCFGSSCTVNERYRNIGKTTNASYSTFFNKKERKPYMSCYTVKKINIEGQIKRYHKFMKDSVRNIASNKDFLKSGYDKGHLKPAAVSKQNIKEMKESFLLSNVAPQFPYFNRVVWRSIESQVRALLKNQDSLIVYTGVVYKKRAKKINGKVEVPYYFYKTILLGDSTETIAYLAKNDSSSLKGMDFKTTVNKIEKLVGFNFYPGLSENLEN